MLWGHIVFRIFLFVFLISTFNAKADGFGFMTPSGNIHCNGYVSGGGGLSCTIVSRSGPLATPKPGSCNGVWGHDFEIEGSGPAKMSCDTWPGGPKKVDYSDIAQYGVSGSFGDISCISEKSGFTCRNKTGDGFFLSRNRQLILTAGGSTSAQPQASRQPPYSRDQIQDFQTRLNTLGYNAGRPDGAIGRRTRSAISAFQAARQVPQTGILSEADVNALMVATSPNPGTSKAIGQEETSQRQRQKTATPEGTRAQRTVSIVDVQKRLNQLGYDVGQIDGVLSQKMRDATAAFQRDNNRDVTGVLNHGGINHLFQLTEAVEAKVASEEEKSQKALSPTVEQTQSSSLINSSDGRISVTTPIANDPFRDIRIAECTTTNVLAWMQYDPYGGPVLVSDFCIDENTATIVGAENMIGFEQVSDTRAGKKYDIPATRNKHLPTEFTISGNAERDYCGASGIRGFHYVLEDQNLEQYSEFDFATATGFTVDGNGSFPISSGDIEAHISFQNFTQYDLANRTIVANYTPGGASVYGILKGSDNEGLITIVEGNGTSVGDATGELSLAIQDSGEVRLSGSFAMKSLDENGEQLAKWTSIQGEVKYFRGYMFGGTTSTIRGYGLATGTFENIKGEVHPFRSQVELWICQE
ncbi:MAG: peptidoglycan-binding domain-containing protein [Stappiaceae bacterium]